MKNATLSMSRTTNKSAKGTGGAGGSAQQNYMRFSTGFGSSGQLGGYNSLQEVLPNGVDTPITEDSPPGLLRELRDEANGLLFQLISADLRPGIVDQIKTFRLTPEEPVEGELWNEYFSEDSQGFPLSAVNALIAKGDRNAYQSYLLNGKDLLIEGGDSRDILDFNYTGKAFIAGGYGADGLASAVGSSDNTLVGANDTDYLLSRAIRDYLDGQDEADTFSVAQGGLSRIQDFTYEELDRIIVRLDSSGRASGNSKKAKGSKAKAAKLKLSDFASDPIVGGGYTVNESQVAVEGIDKIDAGTRFIYTDAGMLYFDGDGSGKGARTLVTTLVGAPDLTKSELASSLFGYSGANDPYYSQFLSLPI